MSQIFTEAEFAEEALPHLNDLFRAAVRLLMNRDEAEDLVQEVYMQAWKSFDRYEQGTNCKAWLFKIMFHKLDHYRRRQFARGKYIIDSDDETLESVAYEPPVNHNLQDEEILDALNKLPLNYRAVILLADVEEWSYKEVADILHIPIGTVMSRLSRARKQLRQHLSHYSSVYGADKKQVNKTSARSFSSLGNMQFAMAS
jgi:RNA polymerase sigma-70 factor (ECF subfamily)